MGSLICLVAAPAIVRAASLMPVKVIKVEWSHQAYALGYEVTYEAIYTAWCTALGGRSYTWHTYAQKLVFAGDSHEAQL